MSEEEGQLGHPAPKSGGPSHAANMETEGEAEADDDEDYEPSEVEPSWAKKIKRKTKKLFCMESHGQYMSHVSEKKARSRHKELMRQLVQLLTADLREGSLMRRSGFSSIASGPIQTQSSFRPMMAVQMIPLGCDVRDPQLAITWSCSNALCPFGVSMPKGERV